VTRYPHKSDVDTQKLRKAGIGKVSLHLFFGNSYKNRKFARTVGRAKYVRNAFTDIFAEPDRQKGKILPSLI
jgi:hypothetical protein